VEDRQRLIGSLAHWLATGKLESHLVLPALQQLSSQGAQPQTLLALLESLEAETDETLAGLTVHLRSTLRKEALRFYEKKKQGQRLSDSDSAALEGLSLDIAKEWNFLDDPTGPVNGALRGIRDFGFAIVNVEKVPQLFREIKDRVSQTLAEAHGAISSEIERSSPAPRCALPEWSGLRTPARSARNLSLGHAAACTGRD